MSGHALRDRFKGCLLGLALGDAFGAPHEGGPLERLVWWVIGRTRDGKRRWTDDTRMSIDLAESLVEHGTLNADDVARRFAESYRWSRGYGPAAAKLLKRIHRGADWRTANRSVYSGGSYGNGGAMRAPVVGLAFAGRESELVRAAQESAAITHAHPLGIEGAVLIATATATALRTHDGQSVLRAARDASRSEEFCGRLDIALDWFESGTRPEPGEVRRQLGNGIAATESCVTAVHLAARHLHQPFADLLDFTRRLNGDVDTIGAMAGAVWGAVNGFDALPSSMLGELEDGERIGELARQLHERFATTDRA